MDTTKTNQKPANNPKEPPIPMFVLVHQPLGVTRQAAKPSPNHFLTPSNRRKSEQKMVGQQWVGFLWLSPQEKLGSFGVPQTMVGFVCKRDHHLEPRWHSPHPPGISGTLSESCSELLALGRGRKAVNQQDAVFDKPWTWADLWAWFTP